MLPASCERAALRAQVRDSYATVESLAIYRQRVDRGLRTWETTVIQQQFPARGRVLTLGCGARIVHTSDLGESWDNVFVVTCRA